MSKTSADAIVAADHAISIGHQPWPLVEKTVYKIRDREQECLVGILQCNWWGVIAIRIDGIVPPPWPLLYIQWTDLGIAERCKQFLFNIDWDAELNRIATLHLIEP